MAKFHRYYPMLGVFCWKWKALSSAAAPTSRNSHFICFLGKKRTLFVLFKVNSIQGFFACMCSEFGQIKVIVWAAVAMITWNAAWLQETFSLFSTSLSLYHRHRHPFQQSFLLCLQFPRKSCERLNNARWIIDFINYGCWFSGIFLPVLLPCYTTRVLECQAQKLHYIVSLYIFEVRTCVGLARQTDKKVHAHRAIARLNIKARRPIEKRQLQCYNSNDDDATVWFANKPTEIMRIIWCIRLGSCQSNIVVVGSTACSQSYVTSHKCNRNSEECEKSISQKYQQIKRGFNWAI